MTETWYRFVDSYCVDGTIQARVFTVARYTNQGVWLKGAGLHGGDRWVSRFSRKRFAYPTVEEALESYKIRKQHQIGHGRAIVEHAQRCLDAVNDGNFQV